MGREVWGGVGRAAQSEGGERVLGEVGGVRCMQHVIVLARYEGHRSLWAEQHEVQRRAITWDDCMSRYSNVYDDDLLPLHTHTHPPGGQLDTRRHISHDRHPQARGGTLGEPLLPLDLRRGLLPRPRSRRGAAASAAAADPSSPPGLRAWREPTDYWGPPQGYYRDNDMLSPNFLHNRNARRSFHPAAPHSSR